MKYTHSEQFFLEHVRKVAVHNVGKDSWPGDVDESLDIENEEEGDNLMESVELEVAGTITSSEDSVANDPNPSSSEDKNPFAEFAFAR